MRYQYFDEEGVKWNGALVYMVVPTIYSARVLKRLTEADIGKQFDIALVSECMQSRRFAYGATRVFKDFVHYANPAECAGSEEGYNVLQSAIQEELEFLGFQEEESCTVYVTADSDELGLDYLIKHLAMEVAQK